MEPSDSAGRRLTMLVMVMALLTLTGLVAVATTAQRGEPSRSLAPATPAAVPPDRPQPGAALAVPAALTEEGLGLRTGPVAVPLELQLPSLSVNAPVVGVGITANDVMDAPMGKAKDPVWRQAFWYRGSAVPGALSTALIAGHVSGLGRPGVFAHLDRVQPGDPIIVHDTRNGLDVRFSVTGSKSYPLDQTTDPAVLNRIYGAGPVAGTSPQPSADGLSHLTLITCAGTFTNGTHDRRLAVFATRMA
jgi:hypothetical protein